MIYTTIITTWILWRGEEDFYSGFILSKVFKTSFFRASLIRKLELNKLKTSSFPFVMIPRCCADVMTPSVPVI